MKRIFLIIIFLQSCFASKVNSIPIQDNIFGQDIEEIIKLTEVEFQVFIVLNWKDDFSGRNYKILLTSLDLYTLAYPDITSNEYLDTLREVLHKGIVPITMIPYLSDFQRSTILSTELEMFKGVKPSKIYQKYFTNSPKSFTTREMKRAVIYLIENGFVIYENHWSNAVFEVYKSPE